MAARSMYDTVKQAIQDLIAPQIAELKGEVTALRTEFRSEIRRIDEKIDAVKDRVDGARNELKADISAVKTELTYTNRRLDEALEIRERLATLEAKAASQQGSQA